MHAVLSLALAVAVVAGVCITPFAAMFALAASALLLERRRRKQAAGGGHA